MDAILSAFLLGNPNTAVPFPWQRHLILETGDVYYDNVVNGKFVLDFRTRINLGEDLFRECSWWQDFIYPSSTYPRPEVNILHQDIPHLLIARCHHRVAFEIIIPEPIPTCLLCDTPLTYYVCRVGDIESTGIMSVGVCMNSSPRV